MERSQALVGPSLSHVLEEELHEEIILFDTDNEQFISLNESAADVWRLCTGEFTRDEIVARIAAFYDVETAAVRDPVTTAIEKFFTAGLIFSLDG